jgi:hypothetical protein
VYWIVYFNVLKDVYKNNPKKVIEAYSLFCEKAESMVGELLLGKKEVDKNGNINGNDDRLPKNKWNK